MTSAPTPPPPPPPPPVPRIVVYCDESRHEMTPNHEWMAIGGLKVSRDLKTDLSKQLRRLCRDRGLCGELKWKKVSLKRLDGYKAVVDFFFDQHDLRFRTLVVKQTECRLVRQGVDRELAFYKFYYEMLEKWLEERAEYLVLLDRKSNRDADHYTTLRTYLQRHLRGKSWIADLTVIDSYESPMAQLCDILTGSMAAVYNGITQGSAKAALADHIARRAGFQTLRTTTALTVYKFNIFRMPTE